MINLLFYYSMSIFVLPVRLNPEGFLKVLLRLGVFDHFHETASDVYMHPPSVELLLGKPFETLNRLCAQILRHKEIGFAQGPQQAHEIGKFFIFLPS